MRGLVEQNKGDLHFFKIMSTLGSWALHVQNPCDLSALGNPFQFALIYQQCSTAECLTESPFLSAAPKQFPPPNIENVQAHKFSIFMPITMRSTRTNLVENT